MQFISGVQDNGVVSVKVFPHDGRAVGNTNDQVWIDWKGLTQNRLDSGPLNARTDTRSMLGYLTLVGRNWTSAAPWRGRFFPYFLGITPRSGLTGVRTGWLGLFAPSHSSCPTAPRLLRSVAPRPGPKGLTSLPLLLMASKASEVQA